MLFEQPLTVSPVRHDTELLLGLLRQEKPGKALEVGCGSGYLSIELARLGWQVTGVDIDSQAVDVSRRNTRLAGLDVRVVQSDMFEGISGRFDAIIFNPPIVFSRNLLYPLARGVVARIHPLNAALEFLISRLPSPRLEELVLRFLAGAKDHLTPGGKAYLVVFDRELRLLSAATRPSQVVRAGPVLRVLVFEEESL